MNFKWALFLACAAIIIPEAPTEKDIVIYKQSRRGVAKKAPLWSNLQKPRRKTIIYVKNVKKRRRMEIIKCCGRKRCSVGPKRRNETNTQKRKPGDVTSAIKGTPVVVGGTSAAPADGATEAPGDETAAPGATTAPAPDPGTAAGPGDTAAPPAGETAPPGAPGETPLPPGDTTVVPGSPPLASETTPLALQNSTIPSTPPQNSTAPGNNATTPVNNATTPPAVTNSSLAINATTSVVNATQTTNTTLTSTTPTTPHPCAGIKSNYTLSTDKLTWAAARLECKKKGMDLVNLETPEEKTCVYSIIEREKQNSTMFWLALNKIGQRNYTQWLSGALISYNDWKTGEPSAFATENCAVIQQGKWLDALCLDLNNYVCETPQPLDVCADYPKYHISTDKMTFDNARAECNKLKMDLVRAETPEENICIQRQIAEQGLAKEEIWMGLKKNATQNYTQWVDAKPLTYLDWDVGNPAAFATEDCVMFYNHHWYDNLCTSVLKYVCETMKIIDPCENMTSTYHISNNTKSWGQARLECKKMGMDLVSMETQEENTCVKKLLKDAGKLFDPPRTWISLNKVGQPNYTHWANGEPLTYTDWGPGNPAQFTSENCGALESGKWGDVPCDWADQYVCESNQPDICNPAQFILSNETQTIDGAIIECKKRGQILAAPETRDENICIQRLILENGKQGKYVFNGLIKRGENNYTKWQNGAPLNYTDWGDQQPSQFSSEHCGIFLLNHWYDLSCDEASLYVCENAVIDDPCRGLKSNYSISTEKKTWAAARSDCLSKGMDLVSMETTKEFQCVRDRLEMAGKASDNVFISLNKIGLKNYTTWMSGVGLTYYEWATGEPANFGGEHCVVFNKGKWLDWNCQDPQSYVCETPKPPDKCNLATYNVSTVTRTFNAAKLECRKQGQQMAVPKTIEENACIQILINQLGRSGEYIWNGLSMTGEKNYTKWHNGLPLTYTDWALPNEPSGFGSDDCGLFLFNHWYDLACTGTVAFVCETATGIDPCEKVTKKFTISTNQLNWGAARAACKAKNMDLANPTTPEENICLLDTIDLAEKNGEYLYFGLSKMGTANYSQWLSGDPITSTNWAAGNPDGFNSENCGLMSNKKWLDDNCLNARSYICESSPKADTCSKYNILLSTDKKNYDDAKFECTKLKKNLVSLATREKNICLQKMLAEKGLAGEGVWIGLNKDSQTNYSKWENGADLSYTDWNANKPQSFASAHCVGAFLSHWSDAACTDLYVYACEDDGYVDPCAGFTQNYTIKDDAKSWTLAREECKLIGGDLVVLETPEENKCVRYQLQIAGKKAANLWLGLSKAGTLYFKYWINGEPLTYNGFKPGYDWKSWTTQHCASFQSEEWGESLCMNLLGYVCESNPAPKEICTPGQHVLNIDAQTYSNAVAKCRAQGMELVQAETILENMCVERLILKNGHNSLYFWMGLTTLGGKTNYTTWDNNAPVTYWDLVPNAVLTPVDQCMIYLNLQWEDYVCAYTSHYICEKAV